MAIDDINSGTTVSLGIAAGGTALIAAVYFVLSLRKTHVTNEKMIKLQEAIASGAKSFLHTEYKYLFLFCVVVGAALCGILYQDDNEVQGVYTMICFIFGALLSATAGYAGMLTATDANARTTTACEKQIADGLRVAFASGSVMSNCVVGLGLLGLSILYLVFFEEDRKWNYLSGFGFGASSIALFARVGGGVFTKAADVGADLVGKVEQDIPEDDPRNPATIADNVGDNVGDVAGMGADLFESFVGSIIATATLAQNFKAGDIVPVNFFDTAIMTTAVVPESPSFKVITALVPPATKVVTEVSGLVALPFWVAGFGLFASLIGILVVRAVKLDEKTQLDDLLRTINIGILTSGIFVIGFTILSTYLLVDDLAEAKIRSVARYIGDDPSTDAIVWRLVGCVLIGLVAGIVIGQFTEYCTSYETRPTRGISAASEFGAAPVVVKGLGVGMISVSVPTIAIVVTVLACNALAGLYGIALAAVGMLSTLAITLATDAYGPVADNAGGIAEMSGDSVHEDVRNRTDKLDSLGNTTAATGKGFAIGSAVLTSIGLISAFMEEAGLDNRAVDMRDPLVLAGLLIGGMLPFVFAALTMLSVDKSARAIIAEVRSQFGEAPQLLDEGRDVTEKVKGRDGKIYPDHEECVSIATTAAIQEMLLPGTLAVFVPAIIGYLLGPLGLAGLLVGALSAGFMLALTMANAGGAWDNAKKWVEKCGVEGEPIEACVVAPTDSEITVNSDGVRITYSNYGRKKDTQNRHYADLYADRKAAVVTGDTIGDPFKDTSGPALNILIKLMSIVSLVLAPSFNSIDEPEGFEETGTTIAVVFFVALVIFVIGLLIFFAKMNRKADEEAQQKAQRLRQYLAEHRAGGGDDDHDEEKGGEEPGAGAAAAVPVRGEGEGEGDDAPTATADAGEVDLEEGDEGEKKNTVV